MSSGHLCEAEAPTEPAGETRGTYFAVIETYLLPCILINYFKAIPHKDSTADAPSIFSSDCAKRANSLTVIKQVLCRMTEKEYPKGTSFGRNRCGAKPQGGLCAVLP